MQVHYNVARICKILVMAPPVATPQFKIILAKRWRVKNMPVNAWPLRRVKINGTYGSPAILSNNSYGHVAVPQFAAWGAATETLYDPRALSPVFICNTVLSDTCPHGTIPLEVWHCPASGGSSTCYTALGKPLRLTMGIYEWSGNTVTRWPPPDASVDTLAMITSVALLFVLLYLKSSNAALIRNWACASVVLHITSGGTVATSALYSAGAAAAAVDVLMCIRRGTITETAQNGLRLSLAAAIVRHVPPYALGLRSAQFAKIFLSMAILSECYMSVIPGVLLGAALTVDALYALFHISDAIVLAVSLFVGGYITGEAK